MARPFTLTRPEPKGRRSVTITSGDAVGRPKPSASKEKWVEYAVRFRGIDRDVAEGMSKAELVRQLDG